MVTTKIKYKKIDLSFVKKNYPVLYDTIEDIFTANSFESVEAEKKLKQSIAGLCVEIALRSDGTVDLFEDDLPDDLLKDEEDEF